MEDSDLAFDRALYSVGEDGRFHRRYNIIFNFLLAISGTLVYINVVLALATPKLWCHVPGLEDSNLTIEEWKYLTLPRENNSRGREEYSSCLMYDKASDENLTAVHETIACQFGYDYNTTWYQSTIISANNWVCDRQTYGIFILSVMKMTEVIGGLVVGSLGDIIGRRPVFFIALACMTVGRLSMVFIPQDWYYLFIATVILSAFPSTSIAQSCVVTIMEVSPPEDRAMIAQIQNFGYSIGVCLLPIIYWILPYWDIYILVSTGPLLMYLILGIFLIESPRWLLTRGRVSDSIKQLKYIAKVNRTRVSAEVKLMLHNSRIHKEKVYGIASLFSNMWMTKNTILLVLVWMSSMASYSTLYYAVTETEGNPFIYALLQGLAEMPAYILGRFFCERYGRRFTCIGGLVLTIIGYITIIQIINDLENIYIQFAIITVAKFGVCLGFYVISLQGLEIYPTCIRQTAYSFGVLTGTIFAALTPYFLLMGKDIDARIPYVILALLAMIAVVAELYLPETLHERLPDTLHEAKMFGKDQSCWSLPHRKTDPSVLASTKIFRRQFSETMEMDPVT